jgi:hypothetical protein
MVGVLLGQRTIGFKTVAWGRSELGLKGARKVEQKGGARYGARQWQWLAFGLATAAGNRKLCLRAGSGKERKNRGKKKGSTGWAKELGRTKEKEKGQRPPREKSMSRDKTRKSDQIQGTLLFLSFLV